MNNFSSNIGKVILDGPMQVLTQYQLQMLNIILGHIKTGDVEQIAILYREVHKKNLACQIMEIRLKAHFESTWTEIDPMLIMWLSLMCSTPADAILLLATIKHYHSSGDRCSLSNYVTRYLLAADDTEILFPTRENLERAWDLQKFTSERAVDIGLSAQRSGSDNLLDYQEAWS